MIVIPSKGRLNSGTINELTDAGLRPIVFIHESERADYRYCYPTANLATHTLDDIGLIRAEIMTMARDAGAEFVWQVDDDIRKFMWREDGKHRPYDVRAWFINMEREFLDYPTVALGGPVPIQYAWTTTEPILNGHFGGVTLLRTAAPIQYQYGVIEDMDIVCQAWAAGWHTLRLPDFAYDTAKMNTSQGGMREAYDSGWQEPRRDATLVKWKGSGLIVEGGRYGFHLSRKNITKPERMA